MRHGSRRNSIARKAEYFDPVCNRWESLPSLIRWRNDAAVAVWGSWLYVCGGEDGIGNTVLSTIECLDLSNQNGRWEVLSASMQARRRSFAAVAVENNLIVCGGTGSPLHQSHIGPPPLSSVEVLDLQGPSTWESLPSMLMHRASHAAVKYRRTLFVCGGAIASGQSLSSCECMDLETEVWSNLPAMQIPRAELAAVVVSNTIFVMGGRRHNCSGEHALQSVEFFNIKRRDWELLPQDMIHPRLGFCAGAADPGIRAGRPAGQRPQGEGGWQDQVM